MRQDERMSVTEPGAPEPLSPVAVPAPEPAAAAPYAPAYPSAPVSWVPPAPKKFNGLGLAALLIMVVAYLVPIGFLIAPIVASSDKGWGVIGGFIFLFIGFVPAAAISLIGIVLAIISLTLKERGKVLGIVALIMGTPSVLAGLVLLPVALQFLGA